MNSDPGLLTTSTNRNILHPNKKSKERRETDVQRRMSKGKHGGKARKRDRSTEAPRAPVVSGLLDRDSSPNSQKSAKSGRSQLVDLVVEDTEADELERVRARKEGGAEWNENQPKHFLYVQSCTLTHRAGLSLLPGWRTFYSEHAQDGRSDTTADRILDVFTTMRTRARPSVTVSSPMMSRRRDRQILLLQTTRTRRKQKTIARRRHTGIWMTEMFGQATMMSMALDRNELVQLGEISNETTLFCRT